MAKIFNKCAAAVLLMIVCVCCDGAFADIVIDVGSHTLLPNTAGQQIDILISSDAGDSLTSGINLNVQIGDGNGSGAEPVFSGTQGTVEAWVVSGTIFENEAPSGAAPLMGFPSLVEAGALSNSNIVANGVLASLLIDTTGFGTPGSFNLSLANNSSGLPDTQVLGPVGTNGSVLGVTINNGSINIAAVPEPAAVTLLALGILGMIARRRRS